MGSGYEIICKKCSHARDVRVGVGMVQFSLEETIEWQSKTEQIKIREIISGKQNLIDEGEGESVFQCSKCAGIANKWHINLMENNKTIYETKSCLVLRQCRYSVYDHVERTVQFDSVCKNDDFLKHLR